MQLLYPIGLLALAGLIIPLIIHLWNVKPGKTLKIGSIALLGESARASSKSFKINDWLLLVLRCLLLILIAFIIAQPFIRKISSVKNKGWILVQKSDFPQAFKENRKTIDSLIKLNYEIHNFAAGFDALSIKDTASIADKEKSNKLTYTSLLNEVSNRVPAGTSVYLFAQHRLNKIGSERPEITYQLNWKPLKQTDTLSSWILDYAGKKFEAKSTPGQTTYAAINSNDQPKIKVAIYESSIRNDKKYLIAALNAISNFSGRPIEINPKGKVDIGFWLADQEVSPNFKSSIAINGSLFRYEKGKIIAELSAIDIDGKKIQSYKRIEGKRTPEGIWTDGFGNTILAKEKLKNLNIFRLYSRFNPQWSQLVWDDTFVKALMPIIIRDDHAENFGFLENEADQRQLTTNQQEVIQISKLETATKSAENKPISNLFWIAALIIFITERILSFREKNTNYVKS